MTCLPCKLTMPALAAAGAALLALPAAAHEGALAHNSLAAGLMHPIFGADHVLAMLAVGLWAGMLGGTARLVVPASFVAVMALGFGLALGGVGLPFVEPAILASVVVLGLVVALGLRVPLAAGAGLVAVFALFHGHAHGGELGGAGALGFMAGFVLATAALHGLGLALGHVLSRGATGRVRALGAGVATLGAALALAG